MSPSPVPRRVALGLAAAILLCLVGFALAVDAVRDRIDARAADESVRLVSGRLEELKSDLALVTGDYNNWTEAYDQVRARNLRWFSDNYGITAVTGTSFDGTVIFGGPLDAPAAWVEGGDGPPGPSHLPQEVLDRVAVEVARQPLGERTTFDAFVGVGGRLLVLSASRVQPFEVEAARALDPATLAIAVNTETVDESSIGEIVKALWLEDLAFVVDPAPGLATVPVRDYDGRLLGALAWTPPRPGTELVAALAPVLWGGAAAFLGLGGVAVILARALLARLVAGEAEARRLARTDSLTGLPNRLAFVEALERLEASGPRQAAVLFADLNGFKGVNDTLGHAAGDAVVATLAERLGVLVQPGAFLARVGGDEFVFVVTAEAGVAARAAALSEAVEAAVGRPFAVLGHEVRLGVAQGLALRDAPDVPLSELVRQADLSMYAAKRGAKAPARAA